MIVANGPKDMQKFEQENFGNRLDLTVCICTWNRASSLRRTLDSLVSTRKPQDLKWEVLVVDNNSTDTTEAVTSSFIQLLPIRRIFEKKPGLSNARNSGANASCGKYIIWTDDDVVVSENWILEYMSGFKQYSNAAIFGGPIQAVFDGEMPDWLAKGWRSASLPFCQNDLGSEIIPLSQKPLRLPYGANFAVRRVEQLKSLYDPALGASPNNRLLGEETTVIAKILSEGSQGIWLPGAKVEHINGEDRMTLEYIKSYYMKSGRTKVAISPTDDLTKFFKRPKWVWRLIIQSKLDYYWSRAFKNPAIWLEKLAKLSVARGIFDEYGRPGQGHH